MPRTYKADFDRGLAGPVTSPVLVNPAYVAWVREEPDGDLVVGMSDGTQLRGFQSTLEELKVSWGRDHWGLR